MSKAKRKARPSPPSWYFYDNDDCWWCKNRKNCNSCKLLKKWKWNKQYKIEQERIKNVQNY